ncbi:hypothetical protein GCM10011609_62840 [Lentzea pudingi]|uniref:BioF2-like acetyltransferase domain-containing protein n=1 Tax=Lentzea pudingi TaxID=1789439 RepID=A0ABQ2IJ78_9PSEU|nr:GNAT family N-acetyltransferase [Lentzea pudingi]GGN13691.1 hypothetical protein GCM10011609_62840 [Lentzea pudingi]
MITRLSLAEAAASPAWASLCGPADLFCTPAWLEVERAGVGPWVPREAACLTWSDADGIAAGTTAQVFNGSVTDDTVRLDLMLPAPVTLDRALLCGTWFNSSVLHDPVRAPAHARLEVAEAAVAFGASRDVDAVYFPYVDAADTDLRKALAELGFLEFPAPDRHVFPTHYADYDEFLGSLRSHRRTRLRKELSVVASANLTTAATVVDDSNVEQLSLLAHLLERKYEQQSTLDELTGWFAEIARRIEVVAFTAAPAGEDPFGMSLWLRHHDLLYGFHAGFDYSRAGGLPLYTLVGYHLPIQHACADPGLSALEYGISSDDAKRLRGTTALPQVLAVRGMTDSVTSALSAMSPQ